MRRVTQLAIDFTTARDEGMSRVAGKAERKSPGFTFRADCFLIDYVAVHARFTGEDCTDAAVAAGICPHDQRAFGPVYMRAIRKGLIRRVGYEPRRKGHGSPGPVYERAAG